MRGYSLKSLYPRRNALRSGAGQKEPTDINAHADEYLRLSYQGLRAKDNSFNATIQTGFDASIGKINFTLQDYRQSAVEPCDNPFSFMDTIIKSKYHE